MKGVGERETERQRKGSLLLSARRKGRNKDRDLFTVVCEDVNRNRREGPLDLARGHLLFVEASQKRKEVTIIIISINGSVYSESNESSGQSMRGVITITMEDKRYKRASERRGQLRQTERLRIQSHEAAQHTVPQHTPSVHFTVHFHYCFCGWFLYENLSSHHAGTRR